MGLFFVALFLIFALDLAIQTPPAQKLIRMRLTDYLNGSFRGTFAIGGMDIALWSGVVANDVTIRDHGNAIIKVGRLAIRYSLISLIRGQLGLSSIEISDVTVDAERGGDAQWNVLTAFASRAPPTTEKSARSTTIVLRRISVEGANIRVALDGKEYRISRGTLDAVLVLRGSYVDADVRRIAFELAIPDARTVWADASLSYSKAGSAQALRNATGTFATQASRVRLKAIIPDLAAQAVDATISLDSIGADDIRRVFPQWSQSQSVSGTIRLSGTATDMHAGADLSAAGAKLTSAIAADVSEGLRSIHGQAAIAGFSVRNAFPGSRFGGTVDIDSQFAAGEPSLAALSADARVKVQDTVMDDRRLGLLNISANLRQSLAKVAGSLSGNPGQANWKASVKLAHEPVYNATVTVSRFNLAQLYKSANPVRTNLALRLQVAGSGTNPATMKTRANVRILPSVIGPLRLADGEADARIAAARINAKFQLVAAGANLRANGTLALTRRQPVKIDYDFEAADLRPLLAMVHQDGAGALSIAGGLDGTRDLMTDRTIVSVSALRYQKYFIGCGDSEVDLQRSGQGDIKIRDARLSLQNVAGPVRLKAVDVSASVLAARSAQSGKVAVAIRDEAAREYQLAGAFQRDRGNTQIVLHKLSIHDKHDVWNLRGPATIDAGPDSVLINQFRVASGGSEIFADGRIGNGGAQNLSLTISALPLRMARPFLPPDFRIAGMVNAGVRVTGTADAPVADVSLKINGVDVEGAKYNGLSVALGYRDRKAKLELSIDQDSVHELRADGQLGAIVSWAHGVVARPAGDLALQARSQGLSLAFLDAIERGQLRDTRGILTVDLTVTGPITNPLPSGYLTIRSLETKVVATGVVIEDAELSASGNRDRIRLDTLRVLASGGHIDGSGSIDLRERNPSTNVMLRFDNWPAIDTHEYRARISGDIRCTGQIASPQITGNIKVLNGVARPDIAFLTGGPPPRDSTIVLVSNRKPPNHPGTTKPEPQCPYRPPSVLPSSPAVQKSAKAQGGPTVDVRVDIPGDLWVKQENGAAELTGKLHITQAPGHPLSVAGEITTRRGWLVIMGKQFTVSEAKVTFAGGSPDNPWINATADYKVPNYLVHVIIAGQARKPTLTFKSEPSLEQADIMSVLLFGKPASQLSSGEKKDLGQRAAEMATGFAAQEAGQQLAQALGLDQYGIEIRQSAGGVGVGKYLGRDTYLTVSQDLTRQGGQRVDVEHYLGRHWEVDSYTKSSGDRGSGLSWHTNY